MPLPRSIERLTDAHQVTVILRLVLNRRGQLTHGEIVDVEGTTRIHFKGWRALTRALREWLAHQPGPPPPDR